MQGGQLLHLCLCQAFEACIGRMGSELPLGLPKPMTEGLGINAEHGTTVGLSNGGHESNSSFESLLTETTKTLPGISRGQQEQQRHSQGYPEDNRDAPRD